MFDESFGGNSLFNPGAFGQQTPRNNGGQQKLMSMLYSMMSGKPQQGYEDMNPQDDYFSNALREQYQGPRQQENPYQQGNFGKGSSLIDLLRHRESSGNYGATNNLGYSGAYQFGAPALETVGYLKPGAGRQGNRALNDPNNWTIPGGKEAFLRDKGLQDAAMQKLMERNKQTLKRMGLIDKNTDPRKINAMLAAAHIAGPGGVKALLKGKNRRDAYGAGAEEYWKLGMNAT